MRGRTIDMARGAIAAVLAVGLVAAARPAGATATITGVSGQVEQRSVITITGSSFGSAPNVVLFDDFEGGTNGEAIMTGPGSAMHGQWNAATGLTKYDNTTSVSGSLAFQADQASGWVNYAECLFPANTLDFFACWWMYIPPGDRIPGEGTQDSTNWKTVWVQGAGTADDDQTLPTFLATAKVMAGNDSPYTRWMSIDFQKGEWKRVWVWIKGGYSNDGACQYWELDDPGGVIQRVNDNNVSTMYSGGIRERIRMNGYGRTTPDCHPGFDDFYVAVGANARARVEIGNNPTYGNCTALAICVPTSWSATSVTAKCNIGGLDSDDDWYLFVIDAAGSISPGYLVASTHTLTVTNGSGGGQYALDTVVPISANPPASGKAFAVWVGDFAYVADRLQASTTVTMPAVDVAVTAAYVNVYTLTVNSGTGDGQYTAGTVVNIDADPAATGKQFDQWTGDTFGVADTESANTTITMSGSDTEITAAYTDISPAYWPGDVNQDFFVGGTDLDYVLADWGHSGGEIIDPRADVNNDNFVGGTDLDYVLADWGKTGGPP